MPALSPRSDPRPCASMQGPAIYSPRPFQDLEPTCQANAQGHKVCRAPFTCVSASLKYLWKSARGKERSTPLVRTEHNIRKFALRIDLHSQTEHNNQHHDCEQTKSPSPDCAPKSEPSDSEPKYEQSDWPMVTTCQDSTAQRKFSPLRIVGGRTPHHPWIRISTTSKSWDSELICTIRQSTVVCTMRLTKKICIIRLCTKIKIIRLRTKMLTIRLVKV